MEFPFANATGTIAPSRRCILRGGLGAAVVLASAPTALFATHRHVHGTSKAAGRVEAGDPIGPTIRTKGGTEIYYKDFGKGPPLLFSHGWPLNADVWDDQMMFMASRGYRGIAFDRRGHGRSSQPWEGNNYDNFAEDLSTLINTLDLTGVTLVGHSAGAGDIARYIGRYGTARISRVVLVSAIPPLLLRTPANPAGVPISVFDGIRAGLAANRAEFFRALGDGPFFGANRPGSKVSQGVKDSFWLWCMQSGAWASYAGIGAFSETDFTQDLARFDVPTLIIHGEDDQNVPLATTARISARLIKGATLSIYQGAPHGLTVTHRDRFNADLLAFTKGLA